MIPFTPTRPRCTARKPSEEGYILLGVLILLAIFIISMAIAAPKIASEIQRDRDVETMHRGKQYIRAIQLYYRKFNAYPPSIDALVKTNEIRFLRKRYIDPTTGKDDWKPVMFGQNKAPLAMGFFGQPIGGMGGAVIAGTGPSGGNGLEGSGMFGGGSTVGGPGTAGGPGGGIMGSNPTSPTSPTTGTGTGDPSNPNGQNGTGSSSTDANGNPTGGQTFGGGGVIGFSPASPKQSILVYKKKSHYNEWEFCYTPLMDMQTMSGGNTGTIGQPVGGQSTPTGNAPSTIGPGSNNGSTPMNPLSPTNPSPQQ